MLLSQLLEEIKEHLFFNSLTTVLLLGELDPNVHKALKILLEFDNHILFWQIIQFELLDYNKDEKIEHDVRTYEDECIEI